MPHEEPDREDKQSWYGPHNWFNDFPDIFRTRLVATYFDGVGYFSENVKSLAERTTPVRPGIRIPCFELMDIMQLISESITQSGSSTMTQEMSMTVSSLA